MEKIFYTVPAFESNEINAVTDLLNHPEHIIAEKYTKLARDHLKKFYEREVLLTHSCTAALEMSALLLEIQHGDEVILPSYTFVSTANAFALFGAKPVFIDIGDHTLNIDVTLIEAAITKKTKAIIVVHYAGIACDMEKIHEIAQTYKIPIIEDSAQTIGAKYKNQHLGTFGELGALSFHATKNITSGLGGGLVINNENLVDRAKIIWQKGTNREAFLEGNIDKYTWQDLGSSYMLNELGAALLYGQLQRLEEITKRRLAIWSYYHNECANLERYGFRRPYVPLDCEHNAHIYYLIAPSESIAVKIRQFLAASGISAPFHYIPLHLAPAGKRLADKEYSLPVCEDIYKRIIRLPLWEQMNASQINYTLAKLFEGAKLADR